MKKQEKIELLQKAIEERLICRCFFTYDPNYYYFYPNAVSDKFILGQEEDDFLLDGYSIRKLSHLKKVEIKDDKYSEINRLFGIEAQVSDPNIDLDNWHRIFMQLRLLDTYLIIEDHNHEQFAIGVIEKVERNRLLFKSFDADGVWSEEPWEIPFQSITSVSWGTRYDVYWKRYMELPSTTN